MKTEPWSRAVTLENELPAGMVRDLNGCRDRFVEHVARFVHPQADGNLPVCVSADKEHQRQNRKDRRAEAQLHSG